jgi:integrase
MHEWSNSSKAPRFMSNSALSLLTEAKIWRMPIVPERYDRRPLTSEEAAALISASRRDSKARGLTGRDYAKEELQRLQRPIYDVIALRSHDVGRYRRIRRVLYCEMAQRGTVFWEWSQEDWVNLICPTFQEYTKEHGPNGARPALMDIAYLLGNVSDLRAVGQKHDCTKMARYIFGVEVIEQAFKRITDVLLGQQGRGYSDGQYMQDLKQSLCMVFLLNRSPYLEDVSLGLLQMATETPHALPSAHIVLLSDVLQEIGLLKQRLEKKSATSPAELRHLNTDQVSSTWVKWCLAWTKQDINLPPHQRRRYLEILLTVGRWLAANHPDIISPEQWDEHLALDYVDYLCCTAKAGEYVSPAALKILTIQGRVGKPLKPRSIHSKLCAMSRFFRRLQDQLHAVDEAPPCKIVHHFNPSEAFATPQYIRRLIQPDPRDIDEVIWYKLTHAAATLTEEDYTIASSYPLMYYRAAALLWVTSARRPNEISRLQVGCIRRDWDPEMLDEHGAPIPGQEAQLCYLHIPANKTKGPYWVPVPKYVADAIEAWERERPMSQPQQVDQKDNSQVNFLFCTRSQKMGKAFINNSLIPTLCKHAGVPESDARGTITGHRARSTIATMLRRNGLSLEDISQFLGHTKLEMVRAYARTDQFRFGRDMNRANDLMRIVEGVIDTHAAKAGKPNVFFFLGRGADGQPRFCGNPAWEKCTHRLACLKCPMYVGASQAARFAERLEARDELFKFQTKVEMTPRERAAAEGDIDTLSSLIEAEAHVPPPEPPNETFRFNTPQQNPPLSPSSQEAQADLVALGRQLATLNRDLAAAEKRTDGRNAIVRSLKKRIIEVTEQMTALDQVAILTTASLERSL